MKKFIRENPTIAFGLGLPLVIVVVFLLLAGVPALVVPPPQYDVVYATEYYDYQNGMQISVINNSIQVNFRGALGSQRLPRLWRYSASTGAVRELALVIPANLPVQNLSSQNNNGTSSPESLATVTPIEVPDLAGVKIDSSSIAPDGYAFSSGRDSSGDMWGGLFYSSRYRNKSYLRKNGRSISLPNIADQYYGNDARFIGWVIPT